MVYQGTTPTFELKIVDDNVDLTQADNVYVTIRTANGSNTYTGDELVVQAKEVDVFLTQEQTLALPVGLAEIQINWTYDNGKRACTDKVRIAIDENLLGEVLE